MPTGSGGMARAKTSKEPSKLRKTGHNLTPSAVELLRTLADLLQCDESILIETGIRSIFDRLPSGQKEAVSTILRAKGGNLREIRKLNNVGNENGEGEGSAEVEFDEKLKTIDRIHIKSTVPVDRAIAEITQNRISSDSD